MLNVQRVDAENILIMREGVRLKRLQPLAYLRINPANDGVLITDSAGVEYELLLADVYSLQDLTSGYSTVWSGTVAQLFIALNAYFFYNTGASGGGGGEISENQTEVTTGTYYVLASDKNIVCTGDCTIVLPAIVLGMSYRFFIWVYPSVSASVKGTGGDTVNNQTDIMINGAAMVSLQNLLNSTNYSIGL